MKDIDEIRRNNIVLLEAEAGSPAQMANRVNMTMAQYLNLRDGARDSRTGKRRGMRKDTAERFDRAGGKEIGWLNIDHSPPDGSEPSRIRSFVPRRTEDHPAIVEIIQLMTKMSEPGKWILVGNARQILLQHRLKSKQIPSSK
jgi:hypothetical protein